MWVAVSDRVIDREALVGPRLLCESCMRRETLVDVVHFCGVDNSGCESMCMRETMLAVL